MAGVEWRKLAGEVSGEQDRVAGPHRIEGEVEKEQQDGDAGE